MVDSDRLLLSSNYNNEEETGVRLKFLVVVLFNVELSDTVGCFILGTIHLTAEHHDTDHG